MSSEIWGVLPDCSKIVWNMLCGPQAAKFRLKTGKQQIREDLRKKKVWLGQRPISSFYFSPFPWSVHPSFFLLTFSPQALLSSHCLSWRGQAHSGGFQTVRLWTGAALLWDFSLTQRGGAYISRLIWLLGACPSPPASRPLPPWSLPGLPDL